MLNKNSEAVVMLLTGGIIYFYFEIFVRGYSHISMFILGGICFFVVGKYGNYMIETNKPMKLKLFSIMSFAAVFITISELFTGVVVNVMMNLSVWDYSQMKYNFMGQICLLYSSIWALLGLPCVYFYGMIKKHILESVE